MLHVKSFSTENISTNSYTSLPLWAKWLRPYILNHLWYKFEDKRRYDNGTHSYKSNWTLNTAAKFVFAVAEAEAEADAMAVYKQQAFWDEDSLSKIRCQQFKIVNMPLQAHQKQTEKGQ